MQNDLYRRKTTLLLVEGDHALDLSEMHFKFQSVQQDEESPDNCSIRVYNLSDDTIKKIRGEYSKVVLQAGYEEAAFGVIFQGTIKQYRIGLENDGINSYLDILAADGDSAYNFSIISKTMAAGSTSSERIAASVGVMNKQGVSMGKLLIPTTGGVLPRGKVLFGLARAAIRNESANRGATWTIQNGKVYVTPLTDYQPGEAVVLTAATGLIGRVEQTEDGMRCRCLLNPKIVTGALIKIDNASINKTEQAPNARIAGAQLAYNRYAGIQNFANISTDGLYRVYVCEFVGDTRGIEWYCDIVGLSVDPVTKKVKPFG